MNKNQEILERANAESIRLKAKIEKDKTDNPEQYLKSLQLKIAAAEKRLEQLEQIERQENNLEEVSAALAMAEAEASKQVKENQAVNKFFGRDNDATKEKSVIPSRKIIEDFNEFLNKQKGKETK